MKLHDRKVIFHAVAEMFPLIEGDAFEQFADDIRKGQREPILYVDGPAGEIAIVDGRNRYRAHQRNGTKPTYVKWDGKGSLAELAASLNFFRRHLDKTQKASAGVAIKRQLSAEAKGRQLAGLKKGAAPVPANLPERGHGDARDQAAKLCGVSGRYIDLAERIAEQSPATFADMVAGKVTISQAQRSLHREAKRVKLAGRPKPPASDVGWDQRTGDALKVLPTLPRKHFRLVIMDPPYNIGIDYGNGSKADQMPGYVYRRWAGMLIDECAEVLTADGQIWVVINDEYAADYVAFLQQAGLKMASWVKWYETFGNNCTGTFNRTSRHLLRFARDPSRAVFNHDVFTRPSARQAKYGDKRAAPGGKLWDDVWQIPRLVDNAAERQPDFPTQLPLALIRPIVAGCSEPGDHVLDPTSGSGTTGEACILEGRVYTGVERSPAFADLSRRRLAAAAEPAAKEGK